MTLFDSLTPMLWLYLAILALALSASAFILYRRWQSRRALVARIADLSVLAAIGRAIADAPLDLGRLAEVVYRQASHLELAFPDRVGLVAEHMPPLEVG